MMPDLSVQLRAPRIVGVEFPYGHPFGWVGARDVQRSVLEAALRVLAGSTAFGTRIDLDIAWPQPRKVAYRDWQPPQASPIVAELLKARQEQSAQP